MESGHQELGKGRIDGIDYQEPRDGFALRKQNISVSWLQ